jgi:hypothetical protein
MHPETVMTGFNEGHLLQQTFSLRDYYARKTDISISRYETFEKYPVRSPLTFELVTSLRQAKNEILINTLIFTSSIK